MGGKNEDLCFGKLRREEDDSLYVYDWKAGKEAEEVLKTSAKEEIFSLLPPSKSEKSVSFMGEKHADSGTDNFSPSAVVENSLARAPLTSRRAGVTRKGGIVNKSRGQNLLQLNKAESLLKPSQ